MQDKKDILRQIINILKVSKRLKGLVPLAQLVIIGIDIFPNVKSYMSNRKTKVVDIKETHKESRNSEDIIIE